jgi:thiamine-phosphate pyrophosphorylase
MPHVLRILDASLNRAGEGLRVIEDYVRFALDDPFLTQQIKSLRHGLATIACEIPADDRNIARDTLADVGTEISNASEATRRDAWAVCAASFKRTEQSLRSLEEYGKLINVGVGRQAESLRYTLYTLEKTIDIGRSSRQRLEVVQLCVLLDGCGSLDAFERIVSELADAGVGMIQLRDKSLNDRELVARAKRLVALTHAQPPAETGSGASPRSHTLAIINDRADIAAAAHADGLHLGQEDLTVKHARAIVGTRMLIGVSTHNIDQARAAVLDGANYIGAGPTFASRTKQFHAFAGLDYLDQVAGEIRLPTFAIGGINIDNLPQVLSAGINRIAVGAAVTKANKPDSAASALLDMLRSHAANQRPPVTA